MEDGTRRNLHAVNYYIHHQGGNFHLKVGEPRSSDNAGHPRATMLGAVVISKFFFLIGSQFYTENIAVLFRYDYHKT